ncbi:molybdate transport system ATP-binding protein [Aequitasia blattaphilus]|uniref:ATP-binding cassette domain-containing protein n=1 Tax=Aequitasia blattaphilus TaxID=2949332 RepID=A0ABT1E8D2_9FIRM|nr:ATP-binding cassette domain-containing protein [Aequitasia blattaphilus]MCP1102094.1 ATP-binding cassette domain-containing protein [Aequitasia blattaphilus]MCR8614734.1 ATP-binding cassette domain-containing protein [Aequitasia blattaphilus]
MLQVDIEKKIGHFHLQITLNTQKGTMGILGPSGCGKSMTLRCIAGIETPDRGRIVLDGVTLFDSEKKINLPPQKRRVGYLFQNYALFPNMNVEKNILCGLHFVKNSAEKKKRFREVIDLLQLRGMERHGIHQLSGGQQQRVALARILVNQPKLLMLDEPFSALDTHLRSKLQIEIKELLALYGRPVLMVTHNRNEAYHMCENISLMGDGRIFTTKKTKAIFANPETILGAEITGCKNVIEAKKTGEYEVEVPKWGIRLETKEPVKDHLEAIGIRAHYFGAKVKSNRHEVVKTGMMEEPFEWIIQFRYKKQAQESKDLWWRIPKDRFPGEMPEELGISPVNVLCLYPEKNK